MTEVDQPKPPLLRIVRGAPTPEEVAAVVAVLVARSDTEKPAPAPRSRWAAYEAGLRRPMHPAPGAWSSWR